MLIMIYLGQEKENNINGKSSMTKNRLMMAIATAGIISGSSAFANQPPMPQISPNVPTTESIEAESSMPLVSDEVGPDAPPCVASTTNYGEHFKKLVEKPPRLMNPCGLGGLVDLNALKGFDPFGKLEAAIKGAVCGAIKSVHDPFVKKINSKISQANRYVDERNTQYGKWIDESTAHVGKQIYNPEKYFVKPEFPESSVDFSDIVIPNNNPAVGDDGINRFDEFDKNAEAELDKRTDEEKAEDEKIKDQQDKIENGGIILDDGVFIQDNDSGSSDDWESFYNVY